MIKNNRANSLILMFISFILVLSLTSCLNRTKNNLPDELYSAFDIKIVSDDAERYLIHFMKNDTDTASAFSLTENSNYITFRSDVSGTTSINLDKEFDNFAKLITKSSDLKIIVSSSDDPFVRNQLNSTYVFRLYVVKGENDEPAIRCAQTSISLSVNKDRKSGLSLAFPNASFIIKLDVSESGIEILDDTKFEVLLYDNDDSSGRKKVGKICRGFNYWEAPFYKNEIASRNFTLVIKEFSKEKELSYVSEPMVFSFNNEGLCALGSVIKIKLLNQSSVQNN